MLVPGDELPPHAVMPRNSIPTIRIATARIRRRQPANNKPDANKTIVAVIGIIPEGRLACEIDPAVPAAVVDIFAVMGAAVP